MNLLLVFKPMERTLNKQQCTITLKLNSISKIVQQLLYGMFQKS